MNKEAPKKQMEEQMIDFANKLRENIERAQKDPQKVIEFIEKREKELNERRKREMEFYRRPRRPIRQG